MDAINKEASECYRLMKFVSPGNEPARYRAASIAKFPNGNSCDNFTLNSRELLTFVTADPPASSECFLRLVCFQFSDQKVLQSSRNVFDQVYGSFKLDKRAKYLLYHRATGIHMFKRCGDYLSFFLGMVSCRVLYTYHIPTNSTGGVVISDAHRLQNKFWEFMTVPDLLTRLLHSANLAPHPYFIPCLCAVSLMISIRRATEHAFSGNTALVQSSRTDVWATRVEALSRTSGMDLRKLSDISDLIMPMLWEFQHIRRFCIVVEEIHEGIRDGVVKNIPEKKDCSLIKDTTDEIQEVMTLVQGQVESENRKITYWLERGWTQMNIVFNTATRSDALASISLSKKAQEDSSAMKIVAIMTMTFLPGTFFAALFAVPSLDWKDDPTMTSKFWVYWAFTIPSTLAVFALWFFLTNRSNQCNK